MQLSVWSVFAETTKWSTSLPNKSQFLVDPALEERVDFWVRIYSEYTTQQGVFHLPENPEVILGEVDLTDIYDNSVLSDRVKDLRSERRIAQLRLKTARQWGIRNPARIRLQMGLKERMEKALFLSGRYLPMMEQIFKENGLPKELTRIVFVESSFNVFAQSKVGASGLWQIMPRVANADGYIQKDYDKRNHPYYATRLAANLLKQNYRSLKSWPLAITAYNHGATGVKRMVARNGTRSIVGLIDSKRPTGSWGFASENFYSCFLAVLEVEKNALTLFGKHLVKSKPMIAKNIRLKTKVNKDEILSWYGGSSKKFLQYNPHLKWAALNKKKYLPAGIPLVIPKDQAHINSEKTVF